MGRGIADLYAAADRAVENGDACFRAAADAIAEAMRLGATLSQTARLVGKPVSYIVCLLAWRERGYSGSPFDPAVTP